MPDEPTNNGLTGWWGQVAQMTAVGIIGVLLFVMFFKLMDVVKDFRSDANDYHQQVFDVLVEVKATAAIRDAKIDTLKAELDEAHRKLDAINYQLKYQRVGLTGLFPPKD